MISFIRNRSTIKTAKKEVEIMQDKVSTLADDLIYVEDVIEMFGGKISKTVLYAWIREKKIPAMKVGRRFVFSRRKVQSYMTKHLGIAS